MTHLPKVIVMDFETALLDGTPSVEYYRDDFRAISCAFAWVNEDGAVQTKFVTGETAIRTQLDKIELHGIPVVVHNLQFEYGVCLYRFPGSEKIVSIDTMRLVQVADNGGKSAHYVTKPVTYEDMLDAVEGDGEDSASPSSGLGLVSAASRWLDEGDRDHKEPFHALIRERTGCAKRSEGRNLNALTPDELERYNIRDVEVTLALYYKLIAKFEAERYDWTLDHTLYSSSARHISRAKGLGIPVDRAGIAAYRADVLKEMDDIAAAFRSRFENSISEIETAAANEWVASLKSERGKLRRIEQVRENPEEFRFNPGSNQQLAALFVGKLKMTPKFTTKTGQPSFKSAFLSQWGDGGELLKKRRKRLLVLKQCDSLLALSEHDGRWHVDLKACGTTTGRFAGGRA